MNQIQVVAKQESQYTLNAEFLCVFDSKSICSCYVKNM